ncbi:hypothetical protein BRAS3843_2440003 [Bradyrhizobium sp. STM 3843]|nr:hypothetical protein BRAS3843_2440003 [Bradyrhizobium sp. STM 3843]
MSVEDGPVRYLDDVRQLHQMVMGFCNEERIEVTDRYSDVGHPASSRSLGRRNVLPRSTPAIRGRLSRPAFQS